MTLLINLYTLKIIVLFNFIANNPINAGISPKMQDRIKEVRILIRLLTNNFIPVLIYTEQKEVNIYQLIPIKINPTKK